MSVSYTRELNFHSRRLDTTEDTSQSLWKFWHHVVGVKIRLSLQRDTTFCNFAHSSRHPPNSPPSPETLSQVRKLTQRNVQRGSKLQGASRDPPGSVYSGSVLLPLSLLHLPRFSSLREARVYATSRSLRKLRALSVIRQPCRQLSARPDQP